MAKRAKKIRDHDTLLRQWQMLRLIPRQPSQTDAGRLCETYSCV